MTPTRAAPSSTPVLSGPVALLLSAPSGAGKTTVCDNLRDAAPALERAITCTTRTPRPGERDGIDYHFLAAEEFQDRVRAGEFIEHATVYGHRYGTLKRELTDRLARGRDVLVNVDVQGAANIRRAAVQDARLRAALVTVFLSPPSPGELERRLRQRKTDAEAAVARRLQAARRELERAREFDYVVISAAPADDAERLLAIYQAEKLKTHRVRLPCWK